MYDETVLTTQDSVDAVIWKQSPVPTKLTSMGATIDLWLTKDSSKLEQEETKSDID